MSVFAFFFLRQDGKCNIFGLKYFKLVHIMFFHYLRVAIRNIRNYALQNIICILGLAAGFVCFCLTSICVHYENTYDTFHKDWQNIWSFDVSDADKSESLSSDIRPFQAYIQSFDDMAMWPEVEMVVPFDRWGGAVGT